MEDMLNKQEFKHLTNKVNNNTLCVDYFRKSLFNTTFRGSSELKREKIIYEDEKTIIKVNRSLNQRHRDLLSLLVYEKKSKVAKDGSYYIYFKLYDLAKKMNFKNAHSSANDVKKLIIDLSRTQFHSKTKIENKGSYHTLITNIDYVDDMYRIEISPATAKYSIYTTGVSIPQKYNEKIVAIQNNKSRLKALISFMLANEILKNGIFFDTLCNKLDITANNRKSEFRKQISENEELLKEFEIEYKDDKFYLKKEKCTFYPALSEKQIINFEKNEKSKEFDKKLAYVMSHKEDRNIIIYQYKQPDDSKIKIKFNNENLAIFKNNEFIRELNDDEVRTLILKLIEI